MLQVNVIGNLGGDAKLQEKDGRKFTTFRVAHNDSWKDDAGVSHSTTTWVDCVMNDHPRVAEFLKAGTLVAVVGSVSLRVYSSAKDRCMKAGLTCNVRQVELLGGRTDVVPSRLYDENGVQHDVRKFYWTDCQGVQLMSQSGAQFAVDDNGWVAPADGGEQPNDGDQANANEA